MPKVKNATENAAAETGLELLHTELTDAQKLDQIRAGVHLLVDEIRKLTTFLTAPKEGPSPIDALVSAVEALAEESRAQTQSLMGISNTLEMLAGPGPDAEADGGEGTFEPDTAQRNAAPRLG
jgi:hypothetical protein